MVWGMKKPSNFGQFWPDGRVEMDEVTGRDLWYERLGKYFKEQTPEEQKRLFDYTANGGGSAALVYQTFPSKKFRSELGTIVEQGFPPISPIEPHEPPRSYSTRPYKKLGSFIALSSAPMAVDEDLKAIIERLEPGVHQFFPIEFIIGPNKKLYHKKYDVIRIGKYRSSFSPKDSAEGSYAGPSSVDPSYYSPGRTSKAIKGLAFSKAAIGGAHLWYERNFRSQLICLSDELIAEIDKAGLLIPKHYKMKEV